MAPKWRAMGLMGFRVRLMPGARLRQTRRPASQPWPERLKPRARQRLKPRPRWKPRPRQTRRQRQRLLSTPTRCASCAKSTPAWCKTATCRAQLKSSSSSTRPWRRPAKALTIWLPRCRPPSSAWVSPAVQTWRARLRMPSATTRPSKTRARPPLKTYRLLSKRRQTMPSLQTKASPLHGLRLRPPPVATRCRWMRRARPRWRPPKTPKPGWMMWPQAIAVQALQPASKWALCSRWPMLTQTRPQRPWPRRGSFWRPPRRKRMPTPRPAASQTASPASSNLRGLAPRSSITSSRRAWRMRSPRNCPSSS